MNVKRLIPGVLTGLVASTVTLIPLASASANPAKAKFFCGQSNGHPATMAITSRGNVPVIVWTTTRGDGQYTPQVRCDAVSGRFQKFYTDGTLNFLTTGRQNRQPVICVALQKGGGCHGLLLTLRPQDNPTQKLQDLLNVRIGAGPVLNESAPRLYISMDELLEGKLESASDTDGASANNNQSVAW